MPLAYHTIRCPGCRAELDVTSYDSTGSRRLPAQHCDCGRRVEVDDLANIPLPTDWELADDRTEIPASINPHPHPPTTSL